MAHHVYNQFCPIARVSEMLEPKWSMLILSELGFGSMRFNGLRRCLPAMSPTLLSKRLKELEVQGMVIRTKDASSGDFFYSPSQSALDLKPILYQLAMWAHQNLDTEVKTHTLDVKVLMWSIMRRVDPSALPAALCTVIQFDFPELENQWQKHWMINLPGKPVENCSQDPGLDVDLLVTADLRAMTSVWIAHSTLADEIDAGRIDLAGDACVMDAFGRWLGID